MTPEEFKQRMQYLAKRGGYYYNGAYERDPEMTHIRMDNLMCSLLQELGYGDGVDIFKKTEKWYS